MPIINFKPEFAELVASGKKRQTIRAMRKRPFKVGDKLYLYTGLRTKQVRNLVKCLTPDFILQDHDIDFNVCPWYVICKEVHEIEIIDDPFSNFPLDIKIDGEYLDFIQMLGIIEKDGFILESDFYSFFKSTHGLPFKGQLVRW